jgi:hypothetical protein
VPQKARTTFAHRHNPDGSFDSICAQCFETLATESTEAELLAAESAHECKGFDLGQMMHQTGRERRPNRSRQSAPGQSQGI